MNEKKTEKLFASADLEAGQLNALVKIIGGSDVVRQVLANKLQIILNPVSPATIMVTCVVVGGSQCSICHGQIPEDDNMCGRGHKVGNQYEVEEWVTLPL